MRPSVKGRYNYLRDSDRCPQSERSSSTPSARIGRMAIVPTSDSAVETPSPNAFVRHKIASAATVEQQRITIAIRFDKKLTKTARSTLAYTSPMNEVCIYWLFP